MDVDDESKWKAGTSGRPKFGWMDPGASKCQVDSTVNKKRRQIILCNYCQINRYSQYVRIYFLTSRIIVELICIVSYQISEFLTLLLMN